MTAIAPCIDPLDPARPETWLDRPLMKAPAPYTGLTYRKLGSDSSGRVFLARKVKYPEGGTPDSFARRVLTEILPHVEGCTCPPCKIMAGPGEQKAEDMPAPAGPVPVVPAKVVAQPPAPTIHAGVAQGGSTTKAVTAAAPSPKPPASSGGASGPTQDASASPAPSTSDAERKRWPVCVKCSVARGEHKVGGKAEKCEYEAKRRGAAGKEQAEAAAVSEPASVPAAPTATTPDKPYEEPAPKGVILQLEGRKPGAKDEVAEAELDAARISLQYERPLLRAFTTAEEEEDVFFDEQVKIDGDVEMAHVRAMRRRKELLDKLIRDPATDIVDGHAAACACKELLRAEDHRDKVKREANAWVARAERNLEIREAVLLPKVEKYANSIPKAQWNSPKSIRFPGWIGRLQFSWNDPTYIVENEWAAKRALIAKLGYDGAIAAGVLKVLEELSKSGLTAYCLTHKDEMVDGTKFVPGGDRPSLYKR